MSTVNNSIKDRLFFMYSVFQAAVLYLSVSMVTYIATTQYRKGNGTIYIHENTHIHSYTVCVWYISYMYVYVSAFKKIQGNANRIPY